LLPDVAHRNMPGTRSTNTLAGTPTARRAKVHEEVAAKIQRLIQQKLKPGDKLPTQRTMAAMFRVTRGCVKEAVRRLELMGLVDPRSGRGTTVREPSADIFLVPPMGLLQNPRLLGELLDFRKMLEPKLAALAAKRASPQAIAEMEGILRRQEKKVRQGELAIEEDSEFHYTIARASENAVVLKVLDALMDMLLEVRERSLQVEGRPQKSMAGHSRILNAIKRHDAAAAHKAMRRHIVDIEEIVLHKS